LKVTSQTKNAKETQTPLAKLWVVSEVFYPEETSTGYYLTEIAEGLSTDFDVKVLCGQPNYSIRGTRAPKKESHEGVEIFRAAGTTLNKNVIIFRLINMLTLGVSMFFHGLKRFRRGDNVLVVTTPPSMPFIVALTSLLKGATYNLLIHDLYPQVLVAVGKARSDSSVVKVIEFFNRWLYKHAKAIIVVGRDMKQLVQAKSSGFDVPISVIPNWAELEDVQPQSRDNNQLIRELGLQNKIVILHAGNIGYPTDVETIIKSLSDLDDSFHFVFIGAGVKRRLIEAAISEKTLRNLTLLDSRPREEQTAFLNACDIGLVSLVEGMYGSAMPSKTYNLMAAGKPVLAITDAGSELAQVIEEEGIGWHVRPGDVEGFVNKLKEISLERSKFQEMGQRARRAAETTYSISDALEKYKRALK